MTLPTRGSRELATIERLLRTAGEKMLQTTKLEVHSKSTFDFVTQVDVEVQAFLEKELKAEFPAIAFYGEESAEHGAFVGPTWILDPVDGTSNFIYGRRYSCISLGLTDGKKMVFGAIYDPYAGELFHAAEGDGAYVNGTPIHVSPEQDPAKSLLIVSSGSSNKPLAWEQMTLLTKLQQKVVDIRISGSSALNLAYAAAGRGSALVSTAMKPWDCAAGIMLVREAGGVVLNYRGREATGLETTSILAGNTTLLQWVLGEIGESGITESRPYKETYGCD